VLVANIKYERLSSKQKLGSLAMSCIIEPANPISSTPNLLGGLDIVGLSDQENRLRGGNLNDISDGGSGFDFLDGTGGDDQLSGSNDLDFILGGDGNDFLNGDAGNNLIMGGNGDDIINGGAGEDSLSGGSGNDTFVLEFFGNVDTINDFNVNEDIIRIKGVGDDTKVEYDKETGKLSIDGRDIAQLDAGLNINDNNYEIF
jgi:Ca2+-binding RTX toxin-like protein